MKSLEMISNSLENKSIGWHLENDAHYLIHGKSKIQLWISSGEDHLKVSNSGLEMSRLERKGLWSSVQKCLDNILIQKCKKL